VDGYPLQDWRMDAADELWNRAASSGGGVELSSGDLALSAVLNLHGLAMRVVAFSTPLTD